MGDLVVDSRSILARWRNK